MGPPWGPLLVPFLALAACILQQETISYVSATMQLKYSISSTCSSNSSSSSSSSSGGGSLGRLSLLLPSQCLLQQKQKMLLLQRPLTYT